MEPLEGELLMEHVLRNSSVRVFDPHIKPLMELLAVKLQPSMIADELLGLAFKVNLIALV